MDHSSKEEEDDEEDRETFYGLLRMLESPKDLSNYMEKAAAKVFLKQTQLAVFNDHLKETAVGTSELVQNMNYGDELLMEYCGEHLKEDGSFDISLFETFVEFMKALLALLYRVETTVKEEEDEEICQGEF